MRRRRSLAALAAGTVLAAVTAAGFVAAPTAGADDTLGSGFQTFGASAVGGGHRVIADGIAGQSPGTIDSGIPDAEATMTTSSGHALASVLWPSALAGNAGSLLFLLGPYPCTPQQYQNLHDYDPHFPNQPVAVQPECSTPVNVGSTQVDPAVPGPIMDQYHYLNSPLRAEALNPSDRTSQDNSVPGATMTARAEDAQVAADALLGVSLVSDVERVGSARSTSTVKFTGVSTAVSDARSTVTDVSIAGGVITIGSIVSTAHATTDGVKATSAGATTITDMKVGGVPVTVDATGLHVNGQAVDAVSPTVKGVNEIIKNFGFTLFVTQPTETHNGAATTFDAGSLIINWAPQDPKKNMVMEFGGAHVSASATLPFEFDFGDTAADTSNVTGDVFTPAADVPVADVGAFTVTSPPVVPRTRRGAAAPAVLQAQLASSPALPKGVSAWWPVLGLLAALAFAAGVRGVPDRVLCATGAPCERETEGGS